MLNGVFAMSELAIVSARTAPLRTAAQQGNRGAQIALSLGAEPGKFLSTVQIGITLIGIVAGAYSGASLGGPVGERLAVLGVPADWADQAGFATVIALTTYLSLVVGELVPKQVALRAAVPIAIYMARPMAVLAKVAAPLVWLLDASSGLLIRLLGVRPAGQSAVTAEELHMLFAEATRSGVIEHEQHQMLQGVVRLAQRPVRELMTPRTEVDWIDIAADEAAVRAVLDASPHSLLPVAEGSPDRVLGVVKVRDILSRLIANEPVDIAALMSKTEVVPDQLDAVDALRVLQQAEIAMAMVHDEYGHLDGIVTPVDLLTALVGAIRRRARRSAGDRIWRRPRIRHRGGVRTACAQAPAQRRRPFHRSGLAFRSRRYGWPPDRQAAGKQRGGRSSAACLTRRGNLPALAPAGSSK